MAKKIGGIILIVCALFTAFLGIKAAGNAPGNQAIIKDAVYVADGKVLPENEGKVVIVNGTLDAPLPFVDEETGIELNSIVAYRRVEKARVKLGSGDEKDTWTWDSTISENDLGGSKKLVAPGVTLGEFGWQKFLCIRFPPLQSSRSFTLVKTTIWTGMSLKKRVWTTCISWNTCPGTAMRYITIPCFVIT